MASLRQRLGRCGRREARGRLRLYVIEREADWRSHPACQLHLELARAVAMLDLLEEGWCEPADEESLHLSTLCHQMVSSVAGRRGARAAVLFRSLCRRGPFRTVTPEVFGEVLERLCDPTVELLEPDRDKKLLRLGRAGQSALGARDFYAAFRSTEAYVVQAGARRIGELPLACPIAEGKPLTFGGRNWLVARIDTEARRVEVTPHGEGRLPQFAGGGDDIHDGVVRRMYDVLGGRGRTRYLDPAGARLLAAAREAWTQSELDRRPVREYAPGRWIAATGSGSRGNAALKLLLERRGWKVWDYGGLLEVESGGGNRRLPDELRAVASEEATAADVLAGCDNLVTDKYHPILGDRLLAADLESARLPFAAAAAAAGRLASC